MASQWKSISRDEAKTNPLYGIKGWLGVFVVVIVFSTLGEIGQFNAEVQNLGLTLGQFLAGSNAAVAVVKIIIIADLIEASLIAWLLCVKHRFFRLVTTWVLVAKCILILLIVLLTPDQEIAEMFTMPLITVSFWSMVWILYLNSSRRVRLTFENVVLD